MIWLTGNSCLYFRFVPQNICGCDEEENSTQNLHKTGREEGILQCLKFGWICVLKFVKEKKHYFSAQRLFTKKYLKSTRIQIYIIPQRHVASHFLTLVPDFESTALPLSWRLVSDLKHVLSYAEPVLWPRISVEKKENMFLDRHSLPTLDNLFGDG